MTLYINFEMLSYHIDKKFIKVGENKHYLREYQFGCKNDCYKVNSIPMDNKDTTGELVFAAQFIYDIYEQDNKLVIVIPNMMKYEQTNETFMFEYK